MFSKKKDVTISEKLKRLCCRRVENPLWDVPSQLESVGSEKKKKKTRSKHSTTPSKHNQEQRGSSLLSILKPGLLFLVHTDKREKESLVLDEIPPSVKYPRLSESSLSTGMSNETWFPLTLLLFWPVVVLPYRSQYNSLYESND